MHTPIASTPIAEMLKKHMRPGELRKTVKNSPHLSSRQKSSERWSARFSRKMPRTLSEKSTRRCSPKDTHQTMLTKGCSPGDVQPAMPTKRSGSFSRKIRKNSRWAPVPPLFHLSAEHFIWPGPRLRAQTICGIVYAHAMICRVCIYAHTLRPFNLATSVNCV